MKMNISINFENECKCICVHVNAQFYMKMWVKCENGQPNKKWRHRECAEKALF